MNNWAGPKYMIAEGDTYMKYPDDETFPQLIVNYVKLPAVPRFDDDWTPLVRAMRAGDFFVSSGEVLLRNWGIEGSGEKRSYSAEIEWTFPLEFVELVWGDGHTTNRQIISATDLPPFGSTALPDSVRHSGQEMGSFRSLGFSRKRSLHSAGSSEVGQ